MFQSTEAFLRDPQDLYLLRLAAGSISGVLTNIDADGAPAMAFHGDPSLMAWDPASGDHGDNEISMSDSSENEKKQGTMGDSKSREQGQREIVVLE